MNQNPLRSNVLSSDEKTALSNALNPFAKAKPMYATHETFLEAVAREEGWLNPASRCRRNNNPGDIEYGEFAIAHGATGSDGRFAIWSTPEGGFAAMRALFQAHYSGLTVAHAIAKWAPPSENDTAQYISHVCDWSGAAPDECIDKLVLA